MSIYYAGIGSRRTPSNVLEAFEKLGKWFAEQGYTLRSGAADGADSAFERGCDKGNGAKEIYLPWTGFNKSNSSLIVKDPKAYDIAKRYHPRWYTLSDAAKKLMSRNSHQVLGKSLQEPSAFIVCWTPGGSGDGGTGQAIRIAKAYDIPVFDAGAYAAISEFYDALWEYVKGLK